MRSQGVSAYCDALTGKTTGMLFGNVSQAKLPASLTYRLPDQMMGNMAIPVDDGCQ